VLLKGKALLEDADGLARAVETAFFKHVFTRYYSRSIGFSYWRGKNDREVDITGVERGYVITRELGDFKVQAVPRTKVATRLLNIPAALACYWLGRSEFETANREDR
jgi:uncharacterized protein